MAVSNDYEMTNVRILARDLELLRQVQEARRGEWGRPPAMWQLLHEALSGWKERLGE